MALVSGVDVNWLPPDQLLAKCRVSAYDVENLRT